MYYYIDENNQFQGPFSERAYAKWYAEKLIPAGTQLYDENRRKYEIDDVVEKLLKSRTKLMFENDTMFVDKTMDQTRLDVTLDVNHTYRPNETTFLHPDFTQIEQEVDEIDLAKNSEINDSQEVHLQKMVGMYIERRPLLNRRRRFADNFVPFEFPWPSWVPHPLKMSDALRGTAHLQNCLQEFDANLFSTYLTHINIVPHPCRRCHVEFDNPFEMLLHFVSVPHVHRIYTEEQMTSPQTLSMIDVYCVQKMMSQVEGLVGTKTSLLEPWTRLEQPSLFFETADVSQAFDSMKSTVILMSGVPLLERPRRETGDVCEYIEALVLFRAFEADYARTSHRFRRRRFGMAGKTTCSYCHVDFDATFLESFPKHLLSKEHIYNALCEGVSRQEMEYWLSFLGALIKNNNDADWRFQKTSEVSLQENDFPLCYQLGDLAYGDFVYQGGDVNSVLNYVRDKIRTSYPLLDDCTYRTSCRWCHVELCSRYGVLRHVLYDKCHTDRLKAVSNDDVRRLLKVLEIRTSMPLLQPSMTSHRQQPMSGEEKSAAMQLLTNAVWLKHRKRAIPKTAERSFPMGLVNWCELCREDIEHVDGIIMHLCGEQHVNQLVNKARIVDADFDYWMTIFNVNRR